MGVPFLTYKEVELSDLTPGIRPVEYGVLVYPLEAEEKTKGGIIVAQNTKELEEIGGTVGILVAVAERAGSDVWGEDAPKVGDRVIFSRYAGQLVQGNDRRLYRLMKDKDINGVQEAAPVQIVEQVAPRRLTEADFLKSA